MSVNIYLDKRSKNFKLFGVNDVYSLKNRTRDALDDISSAIRDAASDYAPISDPDDKAGGSARHIDSGTLKANPVDIFHSRAGEAGAVGASGFRYRAPAGATGLTGTKIGGQFIRGDSTPTSEGHIFYEIMIQYPEHPFYAKYVAFGTPDHGPAGDENMKFWYKGRGYNTPFVHGQSPQPYLTSAVESVQGLIDIKVGELRAEARLIRSGG